MNDHWLGYLYIRSIFVVSKIDLYEQTFCTYSGAFGTVCIFYWLICSNISAIYLLSDNEGDLNFKQFIKWTNESNIELKWSTWYLADWGLPNRPTCKEYTFGHFSKITPIITWWKKIGTKAGTKYFHIHDENKSKSKLIWRNMAKN